MKCIVLGKGLLANDIIAHLYYELQAKLTIVPVVPKNSLFLPIDTCQQRDIKIIESGDYRDISYEELSETDLVISCFYDKIFKTYFIEGCRRIINIHMAPLPKYRGVRPVNWALKNGEREHGVTIHEITPGVDDGPILSQIKFSIYPEFEEVEDVYDRCLYYGFTLFKDTIDKLEDIEPIEQNESEATHYTMKDEPYLGERRYFTKEESKDASTVG